MDEHEKFELFICNAWAKAYLRNKKRKEFRLNGKVWLQNRLGKPGLFSYRYRTLTTMPFVFPEPEMIDQYGFFDTL